jgi:hypothetical protein
MSTITRRIGSEPVVGWWAGEPSTEALLSEALLQG